MSWKSRNPATGESGGGGKGRMINDDTMEWDFTEWNSWNTAKKMEMKGTTRRVR